MINIAICDDENMIVSQLEQIVLNIFSEMSIQCSVDAFFCGEGLCKNIELDNYYDLIFLDIEFAKNEIDGIQVGKIIRNKSLSSDIIYISRHTKYAMELFELRPFHFLIKPLNEQKIEKVIKTYLEVNRGKLAFFTYQKGYDRFKVQIGDIIYLKVDNRQLRLHLADGSVEEFYGTLKEAYQDQLQQFDFLWIHSAYVVNYDYVIALKSEEVVLTDGTRLSVSRHRRKEITKDYHNMMKRRVSQ